MKRKGCHFTDISQMTEDRISDLVDWPFGDNATRAVSFRKVWRRLIESPSVREAPTRLLTGVVAVWSLGHPRNHAAAATELGEPTALGLLIEIAT
jgi:hypothetical protein